VFSYVEAALQREIPSGSMIAIDPEPWFDAINARFPVGMNRIAWEKVARKDWIAVLASPRQIASDELERLLAIQRSTVEKWLLEANVALDSDVGWIGDSADKGLRMKCDLMLDRFPLLMSFPQHSYVLPVSADWCLNYVMEGDLFFGHPT